MSDIRNDELDERLEQLKRQLGPRLRTLYRGAPMRSAFARELPGVAVDPTDDLLVTRAEGGNSAYHRAHVPGLIGTLHQADAEYDTAKRQALFVQAQKLMYDSAWFGYLWFEPGSFLVHKRIQGFPATWGSLREAELWINEA